ncbi:hypothetical protein N868_13980, partial [Cellulomonas carbonis T26]
MLHRALAALIGLLGVLAIGLAVASATVWRASDVLTASATAAEGASYVVTDPGVLDLAAQDVTVRAAAPDGAPVVLALGRSADVDAWVGTDAHTRVTGLSDVETLATDDVAATTTEPATEATADPTTEPTTEPTAEATEPAAEAPATVADPSGSDLWVEEVRGEGTAELAWTAEEGRWSVLVAAPGGQRPGVELSWPQEVSTPWLVPGVAVGSLLVLVALVWGLLQWRASRRPARTTAGHAVDAADGATLTRRERRLREEALARQPRGDARETLLRGRTVRLAGPRDTAPSSDATSGPVTGPVAATGPSGEPGVPTTGSTAAGRPTSAPPTPAPADGERAAQPTPA